MRSIPLGALLLLVLAGVARGQEPPVVAPLIAKPDAFRTLVNPACSHCRDEAKRRAGELRPDDRVLAWTRGYSDGGAIPYRFFLAPYRVISDSYGVFVYDPDAGFARGFAPSYEFRFHGWRNGIMVMSHKDGTLYSSLTGLAFDGPRRGTRLTPVPTVTSDWGWWLAKYPDAVAYHLFDKYQPVELPAAENADSVKSRVKPDRRLDAAAEVLGVWGGKTARAYPIATVVKTGLLADAIDGEALVVLWEPTTRTASAYRPIAHQPRTYKAPAPDASGVSKADAGIPIPIGAPVIPPQKVTLALAAEKSPGRFQDAESMSFWDVAGRCVEGQLKGYTLEWVDSVQVKWFAWAAEHAEGSVFAPGSPPAPKAVADTSAKGSAIASKSEFLRLLPKPFATLKAVDAKARTVTLHADGDAEPRTWPVEPDAEVKVAGGWGRLEQFAAGDRVWAWLKLDRKKEPVAVLMLADELTEWDMHGSLRPAKGEKPKFSAEEVEKRRSEQRAWLRARWEKEGLPGTLTFHHVFTGDLELMLDHEAMRWGRSLAPGDAVQLQADPPIKGMVKSITPWRERTAVRIVVGELEASELKLGQRLALKMLPPTEAVESSVYPPDIDRARSKAERIEWFLASTYCTCKVNKDVCTGHFYTLASCNPNGCGMPNARRAAVAAMIDRGMSDRQILDELRDKSGPLLLRPHLLP